MATELDKLAIKNTEQKIAKTFKDLSKKEQKAKSQSRKAPDFGSVTKIPTSIGDIHIGHKDPKIRTELKKIKKARKKVGEQEKKLEKHGVWGKDNNKGSAWASREKDKIIKKGFPSKAKMNIGGRANLLEEMGRIDARRHPDAADRAEKRRVIGELNRGYKSGGAVLKGKKVGCQIK